MTGPTAVRLGDLMEPVASWTPTRSPEQSFDYIDLSSVDQDRKLLTGATRLLTNDAPSRARQLVSVGDVLVSTVRPNLNGVAFVPDTLEGATASTGFTVLRPGNRLDGRYLFHWVRSLQFIGDMVGKATGASYPAVSDKIVKASSIPLPPMKEQRRIATILDQADALRAKRREALAHLDDLTQSIFLDMFGDPASNPKAYRHVVLGDVVHSASDGPHVSPKYADSGVPFISTRHVKPGRIEWRDLKYLSEDDAAVQWRKCRPSVGDILYTKGGTTGVAAAVTDDRPFAVWVHVAVLKPIASLVDSKWLESMLNSQFCYVQSQSLTHGIANHDLGLKRMVKIELYLPPLDEQADFAHRVSRVSQLLELNTVQLVAMDRLFSSLQSRAFAGEL